MNRAWRNGATLPLASLGFGINTAAARYGLSVFEGFTAYINEHDGQRNAVLEVLRENQPAETCAVRLFGYSEADRFDFTGNATVAVFLLSLSGYAPARPLRLTVSPYERSAEGDLPRYIKATSHYVSARRAVLAAKRDGWDDVIFLNERHNVTESSRASLLLLSGSRIASAPESDGVLPGITRRIIRGLSEANLGVTWEERTLSLDDLRSAEEVALCSSSLGIGAVGTVDGQTYRTSPLVPRIIDIYAQAAAGRLQWTDAVEVVSMERVY